MTQLIRDVDSLFSSSSVVTRQLPDNYRKVADVLSSITTLLNRQEMDLSS
jgi:hypothetical protein